MSEGNPACLHAAHRKACHRAMRLIRDGAEVRVDERNEVFDERLLKSAEVKVAKATASWTASRVVRCAGRSRSGVRSARATAKRITTEFHCNDERLRFPLGDQVVHDQSSMALT